MSERYIYDLQLPSPHPNNKNGESLSNLHEKEPNSFLSNLSHIREDDVS